MTAGLARLRAAQARADEVIAAVAEVPEGLMLQVAVTDPLTGQRLATGFVAYAPVDPASPGRLRLVR